ncbi:glycosyltransferase [Plantibacter sp. VKM Ac-2880]|uniref:glycosyltransferase n=1 Tax=Plantibacter sp. VKM Ac-2880 TaxID=2783827 RepID=UPI00188DE100|nr:glycosyltransferase [Plantibacter sp. VKM Ac-2880]MBF4567845.1 glycosyltransferase [Plantibacter sp. VKM Ac-2880]
MRILLWHVHGGWTDAFVRGGHDYLLPVNDARDGWGLGRADRDWPASVVEIPVGELRETDVDVVVLQRPDEVDAVERLTGRRPGRDLPAVFVEHNTPKTSITDAVHPLADREDIPVVHVTHFNRMFWDTGRAPTTVVEHGVADPGHRYTGALERLGVVINEPVRRWRVTGTDLLPAFTELAPVDVFGMGGDGLPTALGTSAERIRPVGDLRTGELHRELARRRVYLHPLRWTSLGLALLEAMHLGMPVLALATTEAPRAVPPAAGLVSNDLDALRDAARRYLADPDLARATGEAARAHALAHYGLPAFLHTWDRVLAEVRETGTVHPTPLSALERRLR